MRSLSPKLLTEINSQESGDPFLWLLEISHSTFSTFYFVANTENIISNGQEYTAFPFSVLLTPEDDNEAPITKIEFSNVGLDLITPIRSITSPMEFRLKAILASDPDYIEIDIPDLVSRSVIYDDQRIAFILSYEDLLNTVVPSHIYGPGEFGGLF